MKILFIDTHYKMLQLAIIENNKMLKEIKILSNMEHSSKTLLNIQGMFNQLNMKPEAIDKILVVNGPGSYTGLRIGVTIAKTYAYTLKKEVIAVSSLKAAAISTNYDNYIVVKIDAKRDYYFTAIYDKHYNEILKEQYISSSKLNEFIVNLNEDIVSIEDTKDFNILKVVEYYQNQKDINPHLLVPNYLKDTYIEKK